MLATTLRIGRKKKGEGREREEEGARGKKYISALFSLNILLATVSKSKFDNNDSIHQ